MISLNFTTIQLQHVQLEHSLQYTRYL